MGLGKIQNFLVKSVYKHLCRKDQGQNFKHIWQAKIPLKFGSVRLHLLWLKLYNYDLL